MNSDCRIEYTIDWISLTVTKQGVNVHMPLLDERFEDGRGMNGYTVSKRFVDGRIENTNPDREDMGVQLIFSGDTIRALYKHYGIMPDGIIAFYHALGANFTRVDFAIDCYDTGLEYGELERNIVEGKVVTNVPAKNHTAHRSLGGNGWTIYIGKGSRYRFIRIYDKGAEQELSSDWKRIELQCNARTANSAILSYIRSKDKGSTIQTLIRGFCDFPEYRTWCMIIGYKDAKLVVADDGIPQTLKWLLEQCAPALGKLMAIHGDDVFDRFIAEVEEQKEKFDKQLGKTSV